VTQGKLCPLLGDNEAVRIWDIEALAPLQVIQDADGNWGQITCVKWIAVSAEERNLLCFGTGRGFIALFQASGNSVSMSYPK
jgi:hypothetical protein